MTPAALMLASMAIGLLGLVIWQRQLLREEQARSRAYRTQLARRLVVRVGPGGDALPVGVGLDLSLASAIALQEIGPCTPLVSSFRRGWSVEIGPADEEAFDVRP